MRRYFQGGHRLPKSLVRTSAGHMPESSSAGPFNRCHRPTPHRAAGLQGCVPPGAFGVTRQSTAGSLTSTCCAVLTQSTLPIVVPRRRVADVPMRRRRSCSAGFTQRANSRELSVRSCGGEPGIRLADGGTESAALTHCCHPVAGSLRRVASAPLAQLV